VIDGPFTEAKELIAGYLLIQAASLEEAIERAKRCPVDVAQKQFADDPSVEAVIEVREVAEMDDIGTATDEQRATERRVREAAEGG
jgi:hypothetical protein